MAEHIHLPLHWIDVWNGQFFERRDLCELGLIIYLGHNGETCPELPRVSRDTPINFVIVHDNGVHNCKLHYCHCAQRPTLLSQLIRADYFPASLQRTETAFTCEVLERFHVDYDISKKSAQDFMRVISRLSGGRMNNGHVKVCAHAFVIIACLTTLEQDRYHEFMQASRIYRYLTMAKCAGRVHGIVLPHRDPGDLTVPCFTCPIPNVNLPADWKETPGHLP